MIFIIYNSHQTRIHYYADETDHARQHTNGPFTLVIFAPILAAILTAILAAILAAIFAAIFAAISSAISRRVNYWRFRGDFNRQWFTRVI